MSSGNGRRPMGFFGPFNKWWSDFFLHTGRRPSKTDIETWRAENFAWRPELTVEDIVQHSKGRRDPEKNRLYFVEYRRKMKASAKKPVRKSARNRRGCIEAPDAPEASEDTQPDDENDEDDDTAPVVPPRRPLEQGRLMEPHMMHSGPPPLSSSCPQPCLVLLNAPSTAIAAAEPVAPTANGTCCAAKGTGADSTLDLQPVPASPGAVDGLMAELGDRSATSSDMDPPDASTGPPAFAPVRIPVRRTRGPSLLANLRLRTVLHDSCWPERKRCCWDGGSGAADGHSGGGAIAATPSAAVTDPEVTFAARAVASNAGADPAMAGEAPIRCGDGGGSDGVAAPQNSWLGCPGDRLHQAAGSAFDDIFGSTLWASGIAWTDVPEGLHPVWMPGWMPLADEAPPALDGPHLHGIPAQRAAARSPADEDPSAAAAGVSSVAGALVCHPCRDMPLRTCSTSSISGISACRGARGPQLAGRAVAGAPPILPPLRWAQPATAAETEVPAAAAQAPKRTPPWPVGDCDRLSAGSDSADCWNNSGGSPAASALDASSSLELPAVPSTKRPRPCTAAAEPLHQASLRQRHQESGQSLLVSRPSEAISSAPSHPPLPLDKSPDGVLGGPCLPTAERHDWPVASICWMQFGSGNTNRSTNCMEATAAAAALQHDLGAWPVLAAVPAPPSDTKCGLAASAELLLTGTNGATEQQQRHERPTKCMAGSSPDFYGGPEADNLDPTWLDSLLVDPEPYHSLMQHETLTAGPQELFKKEYDDILSMGGMEGGDLASWSRLMEQEYAGGDAVCIVAWS